MDSARLPILDQHQRKLRKLRISVTDRCNLRCQYCMPEREYDWLPKADRLTFAEIESVAGALVSLGVDAIRLTGGEPLLRRDLSSLVRSLAALPGLQDVAMTTNGILLADQARDLRAAGLQRITLSLDTLHADRFRQLTGQDRLQQVLSGFAAARDAGFVEVKSNAVVMQGINDDELGALARLAFEHGIEPRFIEYMDVAGATGWRPAAVLGREDILARLEAELGPLTPTDSDPSAPARRYATAQGQTLGIIASTTTPFCGACTRLRLTADGHLYTCLYGQYGHNLREELRAGLVGEALRERLAGIWKARTDRGAEERLAAPERGAWLDRDTLRQNPHLEMHTKGG
ncbi:MAG: GTP 3',8-cyclase MoaA [Planctomycetota bacterium]